MSMIKYRYMAEITKPNQVIRCGYIVPVVEYTDGTILVYTSGMLLHLHKDALRIRSDLPLQCLLIQ